MMRTRLTTKLLALALLSQPAFAVQVVPESAPSVPCGVMERFEGLVQILDSGRTRVVDVSRKVSIPCGGSISVGKGWAQIRHRDGHRFFLAANSFIEIPDENVTLFRGELYAQVEAGAGEFRVITANARARTEQGTMVVVYDRNEEETQMISLERSAILENRFEPSHRVQAKAGEATSLNFKLQRVTPSDPRAVSIAGLKAKLAQFNIPEAEYNFAVRMAQKRLDRRFAAPLVEDRSPAAEAGTAPVWGSEKEDETGSLAAAEEREAQRAYERAQSYKRLPASTSKAKAGSASGSHATPAAPGYLEQKWRRHLSAGDPAAEELLYPKKKPALRAPASAPSEKLNSESDPAEEKEKRRLIEELSKIRPEE